MAMHAQGAATAAVYTQGGANPAAMACVTCHGAEGEGMAAAGFPRLAGLSAGYMKKQLADFASGERANPIMQPIAAALSSEEADAPRCWPTSRGPRSSPSAARLQSKASAKRWH